MDILNTYLKSPPTERIIKGDGQYLLTSTKKYLDFTGGGTSNCVLGFNQFFLGELAHVDLFLHVQVMQLNLLIKKACLKGFF